MRRAPLAEEKACLAVEKDALAGRNEKQAARIRRLEHLNLGRHPSAPAAASPAPPLPSKRQPPGRSRPPRAPAPDTGAASRTPGSRSRRAGAPARHHRHRNTGLIALRHDQALPRLTPATATTANPTVAPGARLLRFVRHPHKCPLILGGHLQRAHFRARNLPDPRRKRQAAYAGGLRTSSFRQAESGVPLPHRIPNTLHNPCFIIRGGSKSWAMGVCQGPHTGAQAATIRPLYTRRPDGPCRTTWPSPGAKAGPHISKSPLTMHPLPLEEPTLEYDGHEQ